MANLTYTFLRYLPFNHLSALCGLFFNIRWPAPLNKLAIVIFARIVGANIDEAALPLAEYKSIADFFKRDLRPELHRVSGELTSPIDGTLRSVQKIKDLHTEQIKGKFYSFSELLKNEEDARFFEDGFCLSFYLSPKDYHHVHSPCAGEILSYRYIPGRLWPVNNWALGNVPNLFSTNERVCIHIQSERFGPIMLVLVGAANVGKINLEFDSLQTNMGTTPVANKKFTRPVAVQAGQKIAGFGLGSTVLMLLKKDFLGAPFSIENDSKTVRWGEALIVD